MLGSIDANAGDLLLGWDTDQFNTDVKELTSPWSPSSAPAASARAASTSTPSSAARRIDPADLFHAHIGGMDAYALAFKLARRILADGKFERFVADRYASFDTGYGRDIETGRKLSASSRSSCSPSSANPPRAPATRSTSKTCLTEADPIAPPLSQKHPAWRRRNRGGQKNARRFIASSVTPNHNVEQHGRSRFRSVCPPTCDPGAQVA
jgi:hypothetical protein